MISINKEGILGLHRDVGRLSEDQIGLTLRMTSFEVQVCRCGKGSDRLSDMSYQEPPVASGSGASFPSGRTSSPISVPPPATQVPAVDVPVPSSGLSSSGKVNSSVRSFQSVQQVVNELALGARAPIISGHMLNTLRIQSITDHNVSSGQRSDTFKMYPVM